MHSLAYLQDLITTQTGIKYINEHTSQSNDQKCQRMHYLYMHLATYCRANSIECWQVDDSQLFLGSNLFPYFCCNPYFLFKFKFFVTSCSFTFYRKIIASYSSQLYVYQLCITTILLSMCMDMLGSLGYILHSTHHKGHHYCKQLSPYMERVCDHASAQNYMLQHLLMFKLPKSYNNLVI